MRLPHFMGLQVENGALVARIRHLKNHTFVWTPVGFEKRANYRIELHDEASLHLHGVEMEDLRQLGFPEQNGIELSSWIETPVEERPAQQTGQQANAGFN